MDRQSTTQPKGAVTHHELKQTLGTWQLWGIAAGLVISGEYFGWSYGWASTGALDFACDDALPIYSSPLCSLRSSR